MDPVIVSRSDHIISRNNIDQDVLKILYRLKNHGYTAYMVGGGTRDLLVSKVPKDFDIATNARPNQVKRLFRNCRLIGRRFRLAHILFAQGKIIEVATFRCIGEQTTRDGDTLLIRRDNTFGSADEDARRRDFTINALFYDIGTFSLIDYVGGMRDIEARLIRTIGDPAVRFPEDPIRILRAIKFAARLDFKIEPETKQAMWDCRWEIPKSALPRILEEIYRMLRGGAARRSFQLLRENGILEVIMPELNAFLESDQESVLPHRMRFWEYLELIDIYLEKGRRLEDRILMAALLLPLLRFKAETETFSLTDLEALREAIRSISIHIGLPKGDVERHSQMFQLLIKLESYKDIHRPSRILKRKKAETALEMLKFGLEASGDNREAIYWAEEYLKAHPLSEDKQEGRARRSYRGGKKRYHRTEKPVDQGTSPAKVNPHFAAKDLNGPKNTTS